MTNFERIKELKSDIERHLREWKRKKGLKEHSAADQIIRKIRMMTFDEEQLIFWKSQIVKEFPLTVEDVLEHKRGV